MADDIASLGLYIDSSGVIRATKELRTLHGQTEKNEGANNKLGKSYGGLKAAVAAVGFVALTKQLIGQINEYTNLTNKLKLVTGSSQNLAEVQNELFDIAQRSRGSLEGTTGLYFRLAKSTDLLGISQERLAKVTETVNQAVAVSGTTTQAATAALFQLGQGLAAGAVRGQELNSIMEQTPRVAQAIADGMGIPIGKLREYGEAGKITSESVIAAFENQASKISTEFNTTTKTVQQSLQQIENSALKTFGSLDATELTGAMDEFREIISDPDIVAGLQSIASVLVSIAGLAIKAASGWGMIFKGMAAAADEGSRDALEKLTDRISKAQSELSRTDNAQYKAVLEASLEKYRTELAALTAAKNVETGTESTMTGTGKTPEAAAEAVKARAEAERTATLEANQNKLLDQYEYEEHLNEIEYDELERARAHAAEKLAIEQDYYERLYNMETGAMQAAADFSKAMREGDLSNMLKTGALALSGMAKNSEKMFKVQKALAMANVLVTLPSAIMKAIENAGGLPFGAFAGAMTAAAGAAQLSSIRSASFGGGGAPSTVGGGSSSSAPAGDLPSGSTAQPDASEITPAAPTRELRVTVESDGPNSDGMRTFIDNLALTLDDMGSNTRLVLG